MKLNPNIKEVINEGGFGLNEETTVEDSANLNVRRLVYIIVVVLILGVAFFAYTVVEKQFKSSAVQQQEQKGVEFFQTQELAQGNKPIIWIVGGENSQYAENARDYAKRVHLSCEFLPLFDPQNISEKDIVVFCGESLTSVAEYEVLEKFVGEGGHIVLGSGLAEGDIDKKFWPILGIQAKFEVLPLNGIVFDEQLLPVQPKESAVPEQSSSCLLELNADSEVYVRESETGAPIASSFKYKDGSAFVINGTFLKSPVHMGLLSGAFNVLLDSFIYPIVGSKVIFLDNFPILPPVDNNIFERTYGYTSEGLLTDMIWPILQGMSLRSESPFTTSVLSISSSENNFPDSDRVLLENLGDDVLQFGSELCYASNCEKDADVLFSRALTKRVMETFPHYKIDGLVLESPVFSQEMLNAPTGELQFVRGFLNDNELSFAANDSYTMFPAATKGNYLDEGAMLPIYSTIGAYGMISHVFDVEDMITDEKSSTAWDAIKHQLGIFESQVLADSSWLQGETLSETKNNVKSYTQLDYSWSSTNSQITIQCSAAMKGQPFFMHFEGQATKAKGAEVKKVSDGYFLVIMNEPECTIDITPSEDR